MAERQADEPARPAAGAGMLRCVLRPAAASSNCAACTTQRCCSARRAARRHCTADAVALHHAGRCCVSCDGCAQCIAQLAPPQLHAHKHTSTGHRSISPTACLRPHLKAASPSALRAAAASLSGSSGSPITTSTSTGRSSSAADPSTARAALCFACSCACTTARGKASGDRGMR